MKYFGVEVSWEENTITVQEGNYQSKEITIEADWSAASYWYGMVAVAKEATITLMGLKRESLQGDASIQYIYEKLGVETQFIKGGICLTKKTIVNFNDSPTTNRF